MTTRKKPTVPGKPKRAAAADRSTPKPKAQAKGKAQTKPRTAPKARKTPVPAVVEAAPAVFDDLSAEALGAEVEPVAPPAMASAPAATCEEPAIEDFVIADDIELAVVQSDSELANLFIAEALDHLGTIEAKLLELDDHPEDTGLLNDIFRPFHTVKGNAWDPLESTCRHASLSIL